MLAVQGGRRRLERCGGVAALLAPRALLLKQAALVLPQAAALALLPVRALVGADLQRVCGRAPRASHRGRVAQRAARQPLVPRPLRLLFPRCARRLAALALALARVADALCHLRGGEENVFEGASRLVSGIRMKRNGK